MSNTEGVYRHTADVSRRTIRVTFDEKVITLQEIMKTLGDHGYPTIGEPRWIK